MTASKAGIVTAHVAATIDGVHTEVVLKDFSNRIFVIVTQTDKLGSLLDARLPFINVDPQNQVPKVSVLLGNRECPMSVICARQLTERIGTTKPVLLAISLKKDRPRSTLRAILQLIDDNAIWSQQFN